MQHQPSDDVNYEWHSNYFPPRLKPFIFTDAELVYHTGDMRDHGVWETTVDNSRRNMGRLFDLYREVFGNTPVFHAFGNHEGNKQIDKGWKFVINLTFLLSLKRNP